MFYRVFVLIVRYCCNGAGRKGANLSAIPLNDSPCYISTKQVT